MSPRPRRRLYQRTNGSRLIPSSNLGSFSPSLRPFERGSDISDDDVVTYAINGLSDKYGSLAQIIAHKDPFPDLATVRSMVATEELRLRSRSSVLPTGTTSSAPQVKYASELLERAGMLTCNPCRTPVDMDSKLSADGDPDPTLYRSLAGALQYLTFTRPDISYVVQQVCLYMHDPREPYFSALKRILWYIRGTMPYGLQLFSSTTSSLVAYSDADWAGCPTTRRSTSGYCVFLGNNLLSWSSKRQVTLSRSSAEAEYRGVANAVAETCWLRNLLRELHTPLSTATLVYCDNVSAVYLSSNPVQHQRTKHIEIDIHFVRDLVAAGHIRVLHVPSRYQYADIFTKGLPTVLFDEFRSSLSVRSSPAQTAGGYTMLQGPFSVPWAPYQDPTIEKPIVAEHVLALNHEAGNEKADQDGGHEKKDGGHEKKDGGKENVDGSGTI
ncbi:ribonuclease H-like domain-containing protein [Tanacetum coccineum]